jgi:hypothetical protein
MALKNNVFKESAFLRSMPHGKAVQTRLFGAVAFVGIRLHAYCGDAR